MIKDRLASFKAKIDSQYVEVRVQQSRGGYMDELFEEVEGIRDNIEEMQTKVDEMKKIHSRILCSNGSQTDQRKPQLENIMADIRRIATIVRGRLRVMELNINRLDETSLLNTEIRIRKTQYSNLSRKLMQVLTDHYRTQTEYREWCKNAIKKDLEITNRSLSDERLEEMLRKGSLAIFALGIMTDDMTDNDTEVAKQILNRINERHSEIMNLENNIRELHDMFKDMKFLIENQEEIIDTSGVRVEKTEKYTETAKQDIERVGHPLKSRLKTVLILGVLVTLVFVMSIIVVLGFVGL